MLQLHGVNHIFGLCGAPSLLFYDAIYRRSPGCNTFSRGTIELAVEANEPVLVGVLCQPLEEGRARVSEWIA